MADTSSQGDSTPRAVDRAGSEDQQKSKKRSLFNFVKKKTSKSGSSTADTVPSVPNETSKLSSTTQSTTSPSQAEQRTTTPSSPTGGMSSSPRMSSPARSQISIFERDVQDSTILQSNSAAIPTHIQTENHIPPVLDDASEAITNHKLDPDTVEIVTHNSHQPAAVTVTSTSPNLGLSPLELNTNSEWADELTSFTNRQAAVASDNASNYGSLDSSDVRRLSFISFADVVQSEHAGVTSSRDSIHIAGLTSLPSAMNRSPSPIRSPVSSQGPGTSPPTSNPGSMKGVEMSPSRKPIGSPKSGSQNLNASGELNIETMSQALRRTGSADFTNFRSIPASPIEEPSHR